jgi:hypothetical protein
MGLSIVVIAVFLGFVTWHSELSIKSAGYALQLFGMIFAIRGLLRIREHFGQPLLRQLFLNWFKRFPKWKKSIVVSPEPAHLTMTGGKAYLEVWSRDDPNKPPEEPKGVGDNTKSFSFVTDPFYFLKNVDELVLAGNHDPVYLERLAESVTQLNSRLGQIDSDETAEFVNVDSRILAPEGGIYDSNVQRLLALSGCLRYDHKVRSVYYVGTKLL